MYLDRPLQLKILTELRNLYPNEWFVERLSCYEDTRHFQRNIFYLTEHGLISGTEQRMSENLEPVRIMALAIITPKGLDFLEDDGGLKAILGGPVVKFDDNDLEVLIKAIELSAAPPERKSAVRDMVEALPAEGLKHIYLRLLNLGLEKEPDVLQVVQNAFEQGKFKPGYLNMND